MRIFFGLALALGLSAVLFLDFVTDTNVVAAASIFVIIPVMIVYFALQKHFIAGLTLGANKG